MALFANQAVDTCPSARIGQRRCHLASLAPVWGGRLKPFNCITLDLNELLRFLGTKEGFGLSVAPLWSPRIKRQLGCTDRAVSSDTLLAEPMASSIAAFNDRAFTEERSRGSNGSVTRASSTNGRSHCGEEVCAPLGAVS